MLNGELNPMFLNMTGMLRRGANNLQIGLGEIMDYKYGGTAYVTIIIFLSFMFAV